jgi:hypothetical protein
MVSCTRPSSSRKYFKFHNSLLITQHIDPVHKDGPPWSCGDHAGPTKSPSFAVLALFGASVCSIHECTALVVSANKVPDINIYSAPQ